MTRTPNATPSITPTITITPSITPSVTPTITVTPSITPSLTPSKTPSPTPSLKPNMSFVPINSSQIVINNTAFYGICDCSNITKTQGLSTKHYFDGTNVLTTNTTLTLDSFPSSSFSTAQWGNSQLIYFSDSEKIWYMVIWVYGICNKYSGFVRCATNDLPTTSYGLPKTNWKIIRSIDFAWFGSPDNLIASGNGVFPTPTPTITPTPTKTPTPTPTPTNYAPYGFCIKDTFNGFSSNGYADGNYTYFTTDSNDQPVYRCTNANGTFELYRSRYRQSLSLGIGEKDYAWVIDNITNTNHTYVHPTPDSIFYRKIRNILYVAAVLGPQANGPALGEYMNSRIYLDYHQIQYGHVNAGPCTATGISRSNQTAIEVTGGIDVINGGYIRAGDTTLEADLLRAGFPGQAVTWNGYPYGWVELFVKFNADQSECIALAKSSYGYWEFYRSVYSIISNKYILTNVNSLNSLTYSDITDPTNPGVMEKARLDSTKTVWYATDPREASGNFVNYPNIAITSYYAPYGGQAEFSRLLNQAG
jgi:hypothetical protein